MVMPFTMPASLKRGDLVAVAAPAAVIDRTRLDPGLAWLRERYDVHLLPSIDAERGSLSGSDARRGSELASAMATPEVKAIFAARAGDDAMRLLDQLPW